MQNSRNKTHKRRGTRDLDAEASSKSFISKVGYIRRFIELEVDTIQGVQGEPSQLCVRV